VRTEAFTEYKTITYTEILLVTDATRLVHITLLLRHIRQLLLRHPIATACVNKGRAHIERRHTGLTGSDCHSQPLPAVVVPGADGCPARRAEAATGLLRRTVEGGGGKAARARMARTTVRVRRVRTTSRVSTARKMARLSQDRAGTHGEDDGAGATGRKSRRRRSGLASPDDGAPGSRGSSVRRVR
jgi:hypothetical protein